MDAVEEIKNRLSIEDVIGEYLHLKRAGRNLRALSPFSNEKTPSFMVSPEKQIWHDFSSGKGGNIFSFVMEMEGLDFKGALEFLARKAGVELEQYRRGDGPAREKRQKRLYEALELAAKFYQVQLKKSDQALNYVFKTRRFSKATALQFRLGYAPDAKDKLSKFLLSRGFTLAEIQAAGLAARGRQEAVDMFRGRLIIPLSDPFGRVIGFTARLLADQKDGPKYINTPQTLLYDKSRHIFGLHLAKDAIRKSKFVVAVEGNLDVLASHQVGVTNVVASAGTAMTEMHLKTLGRLTPDVRLAFDQDAAGQAAAERIIPLAAKTGVNLSMINIGGSKDPDELIKKDPKAWSAAINKPKYALDWLIDEYKTKLDIKSAQGKKQFVDRILAVVKKLDDAVEQEHYVKQLGQLLGVSSQTLADKLKGKTEPALKKTPTRVSEVKDDLQETKKIQNHLLALLAFRPISNQFLEPIKPIMFVEAPARQLFEFVKNNPEHKAPAEHKQLREITDYVKMLELQFEELYAGVEDTELQYEATRLKSRLIENYVKKRKTEIAKALEQADEPSVNQLLQKAKKLDQLLNTIK